MSPPTRRLPVAPLVAWVHAARVDVDPRAGETLCRAYHRGRREGWFSVDTADKLAIALFCVHPVTIWGAAYFDNPDEFGALPRPVEAVAS